MGYDLYITRQKYWYDSDPHLVIDPEEWVKYANNDQTLIPMLENGRFFFIYNESEKEEWIDWADGNLFSSNPSASLRRKMYQIAKYFKANLQGEESELYDKEGEVKRKNSFNYWIILISIILIINVIRYLYPYVKRVF